MLGVVPARFTQKCIDLIDEDDARFVISRFLEELSDSLGTDSYEHFIEVRPRAVYEVGS